MELITQSAIASTSPIRRILDVGCGAGNNTLKLRQSLGADFHVTLLDLSRPMLERAPTRIAEINRGRVQAIAEDFRAAELENQSFDAVFSDSRVTSSSRRH